MTREEMKCATLQIKILELEKKDGRARIEVWEMDSR